MKVGFVSLGCSKNLIDTEMAIGLFKNNKFQIVANENNADIIVINTCGFIESAKQFLRWQNIKRMEHVNI